MIHLGSLYEPGEAGGAEEGEAASVLGLALGLGPGLGRKLVLRSTSLST